MKFKFLAFLLLIACRLSLIANASAATNPLQVPNNKFGIHIISASTEEASNAASLVNSGGDWGYVTVLISSKDRDQNRWQNFFNELRRRHLIPIIRLAATPVNSHWEKPYEKEYEAWAEFLNNLSWPTKNRYIVIYNEPNHGSEWGGNTDPASYAKVLSETIDALKAKSSDFFVLNAGFDASAPQQLPKFMDEEKYIREMVKAVPGIFNKLDGWASHSYPNPGFAGSPDDTGKISIRTYQWELALIRSLGVTKQLPVFITETGWKHAEGLTYEAGLPAAELVAKNYKKAFEEVWSDPQIAAVTPFLLDYQENPFEHFSFRQLSSAGPIFYPQYQVVADLPKVKGNPARESLAKLLTGEVYSSIVAGESYEISLTFKNIGQTIWEAKKVVLQAKSGGKELGILPVEIEKEIEPGSDYIFKINLKAPSGGSYKVSLNLFGNGKEFESNPVEFETTVKSPVVLNVKAKLEWKKSSKGDYFLDIIGTIGQTIAKILIGDSGNSENFEARYLLPGYTFDFTLEKPFYKAKTIRKEVQSGVNTLDFGTLQPDIPSAILHPKALWNLLPFSN